MVLKKKRQHMEGVVFDFVNGSRITFAPWPQGDKAGATSTGHLFTQVYSVCYTHTYACIRTVDTLFSHNTDGHVSRRVPTFAR